MKAADVMTRVVLTVKSGASIGDAISLMAERRISGVPVVDESHKLVGIVTEGDLLRRSEIGTEIHRSKWVEFLKGFASTAGDYVHSHSKRVDDLMTRDVVTITADTTLQDAVGLMEQKHVRRLPVLQDGKLIGILSRSDLIRMLDRTLKLKTDQSGAVSDRDIDIEERLTKALEAERWFKAHDVRIHVNDGVVTLDGLVTDGRIREALRVAAENVPGVRSVDDRLVWFEPTTGAIVPTTD